MSRHIGWALAAIAVALPMTFPHARPAPGSVSCGLGLPPGAPGFAEAQAQLALEAKANGYLKVCEANLERYRIAFRPSAPIMADLSFQPVNLSSTQFAHFKSLGAMIEPDNTAHTRLYRGFLMPDGHTVTLFEQDMSVDGTSTSRAPEDEPERINGMPARLSVFQAPSGKAISHLSWVERRRAYELWIDANVVDTPLRKQLFALAASLPPSVPACPNEVPPKPARMGSDGFPAAEPIPMTLTQAEIDAMSDRSKRPCK
ncbi:hypothetical protein AB595_06695 [Massilia sp. WF1]|uniref:hypothetical protein n=1 Tax=unclassified Massilia TaxID=2609279 RepID=UPI0006595F5E|nr:MULTISPECIES: hypothetical protein [unclassified Massilia]KLU37001.1 hypothetical protein AB595_06695 [Massilia sp. WF1]